ncbi:MAG: hypothetical protein K0R50_3078 [Eubacterium sp.]|nr:hypothetical protein [Eubacterium sp.]
MANHRKSSGFIHPELFSALLVLTGYVHVKLLMIILRLGSQSVFILPGGLTGIFLKDSAEIERIVIAYN